MWQKDFWSSAIERAIRTFAQVALGFLVVGTSGVAETDWEGMLSVAAVASFASILMSIVGTGIGDKGTASLVREHKHTEGA